MIQVLATQFLAEFDTFFERVSSVVRCVEGLESGCSSIRARVAAASTATQSFLTHAEDLRRERYVFFFVRTMHPLAYVSMLYMFIHDAVPSSCCCCHHAAAAAPRVPRLVLGTSWWHVSMR